MNSKSRYFSSLLIALVAAFGYYILTDFNVSDIKLKTFSSLGVPFRMYQINNSVKQKKLPLPKVVYAYAVQQDELKAPQIELIADANSDAEEFLAGLTGALLESERSKRNPEAKINDKVKYGVRNDNPEVILRTNTPEVIPNPNKQICRDNPNSFTVPDKVSKEDIEMIVSTVTLKNVKKIEECFKKIQVIYGNENAGVKNVIVNSMQNPNKQTRVTCTTTCTTQRTSTTQNTHMRRATSVADSDEESETPEPDEDTDN